jgi:hypothetical protein
MSMELHVLVTASRLPDRQQWQAAIDSLGYDLHLDPELSVRDNTGFVPCTFKGQESGFEFDVFPASDIIESYPEFEKQFERRDMSANFRWGGDLVEMACVLVASAALAKSGDGVWFDPQEGSCLTPAQALEQAKSGLAGADF